MITIFTYNRLEMLTRTLTECVFRPGGIQIIDDESEYDFSHLQEMFDECGVTAYRMRHCGKEGFYKLWDFALHNCEESGDQRFLFLPDDYSNIDFERIDGIHNHFVMTGGFHSPYVCMIVNDGRGQNWTALPERPYNDELTRIDWIDCGFFCNREALDRIGFNVFPVDPKRFKRPGVSSGVGEQLTVRFNKAGVPIYRPIKSLADHGDHESVMHTEERIKNPLISK